MNWTIDLSNQQKKKTIFINIINNRKNCVYICSLYLKTTPSMLFLKKVKIKKYIENWDKCIWKGILLCWMQVFIISNG